MDLVLVFIMRAFYKYAWPFKKLNWRLGNIDKEDGSASELNSGTFDVQARCQTVLAFLINTPQPCDYINNFLPRLRNWKRIFG